nr:protein FAR1-RELATED SEQUENCE 5-like [Ipomoea batatas]
MTSFIDSSPCLYNQNSGGGGSSPKSNRQELWREIYACVGLGGNNAYRMSRMAQVPQEMKVELLLDSNGHEQVKGNKSAIAQKQRLMVTKSLCMKRFLRFTSCSTSPFTNLQFHSPGSLKALHVWVACCFERKMLANLATSGSHWLPQKSSSRWVYDGVGTCKSPYARANNFCAWSIAVLKFTSSKARLGF